MAGKIVVDTSVLIKWIKTKDEELLVEAGRLLRQVESKPLAVHVPALLLYEIGNILLLKTDLDPDGLEKAVDGLEALPFIVAPPATPLLQRATRVGREFALTFYDASFLAVGLSTDHRRSSFFRPYSLSSTRPSPFQGRRPLMFRACQNRRRISRFLLIFSDPSGTNG